MHVSKKSSTGYWARREILENMKAYKGFNSDMTCRGFKFEEGKEYEQDGEIKVCENGFHACERPLDCFDYYDPAKSVYHEVTLEGDMSKADDDTKVAAKKIKIGARLNVARLIRAQFEYVKEHTTTEDTDPKKANAGYRGAANAGYRGAANAGNYGAANAGNYGAANAGDCGAANAGNYGAANAGYRGAANAGYRGAAISRGSSAVGDNGVAVARGSASYNPKVKGGIGSVLILILEKDENYDIADWKAFIVDGEKVKPDTWYELINGEVIEVKR